MAAASDEDMLIPLEILLEQTFDLMDALGPVPPNKPSGNEKNGRMDLQKGLRWSEIMGCHDSQIRERCLKRSVEEGDDSVGASSMSAERIWKFRIKSYALYSPAAKMSNSQWFDKEAWMNFHHDMIPLPYHDSPVTEIKVHRQLQSELDRLQEAASELNKTGDGLIKTMQSGKKLYPKALRNDCCMFGD